MKNKLIFCALCFGAVGFSALLGFSEEAGLFGAILTGGMFLIDLAQETKTDI